MTQLPAQKLCKNHPFAYPDVIVVVVVASNPDLWHSFQPPHGMKQIHSWFNWIRLMMQQTAPVQIGNESTCKSVRFRGRFAWNFACQFPYGAFVVIGDEPASSFNKKKKKKKIGAFLRNWFSHRCQLRGSGNLRFSCPKVVGWKWKTTLIDTTPQARSECHHAQKWNWQDHWSACRLGELVDLRANWLGLMSWKLLEFPKLGCRYQPAWRKTFRNTARSS